MTLSEATARCWAEINLDNLVRNYRTALGLLSPGAGLIPVLKANAYGCGAKTVARTLWQEGARLFAVACMAEAEEIKRELPDADVLVLGLTGGEECARAIEKGVILTVFSRKSAADVLNAAERAGKRARIQIKLETGLHRLGFTEAETDDMIALARDERVSFEGIFTHLALRDRPSDDEQFARFDRVMRAFERANIPVPMAHACDSIGMVRYPERHMDAVRTGAWLYGVCPYRYEHPEKCLPVMTLKTRVAQIRTLPAGECVGYDDEHPLARESRVATLSAGYVDGFFRFNNLGEVVIRGRRAPVLGLVCMDQMMADITEIPDAAEGDEVILFGGPLRVDEYAAAARLNRNEALCRVGRRVPRVYITGNTTEILPPEIP